MQASSRSIAGKRERRIVGEYYLARPVKSASEVRRILKAERPVKGGELLRRTILQSSARIPVDR